MNRTKTHQKILWITETAVLLALLIVLQWATKGLNQQLITGTCVNAVLAIAAIYAGMSSGITIALISPVMAFLLNIAPNVVTVPAIMAGNTVYVVLLSLLLGKKNQSILRQLIAWVVSAVAKFGVLYILVAKIICGVASASLMAMKFQDKPVLAPPMLQKLPAMFSWLQLATALIGGALALLIVPVLRKALRK